MVAPPKIPGILIGVWSLLNNTPTDIATGQPIPVGSPGTLGSHPVGLLHYTASGQMSVNLASTDPADRPASLTWPPKDTQPDADWATVGRETLCYAGPLSLAPGSNQKNGTVYHGPLKVTTVPSWTNTLQTRTYRITEEKKGGQKRTVLWLGSRNEAAGIIANLYWEKISS